MTIQKLGIVVIYLVEADNDTLLNIHLDCLRRHTESDYTIYGTANRLLPQFCPLLDADPNVRIVDCAPPEDSLLNIHGHLEHGYYLDSLTRAAFEDGCSHVATFHVDSFPVRRGWDTEMASTLTDSAPVTAILRAENGDKFLPFPGGLLFTRDFYEKYDPRFLTTDDVMQSPDYREFMRVFEQARDSGLGYGFALWKNNLEWRRLLRSNAVDEHYLIGGIYGDLIFHLGFAARPIKSDRGDKFHTPGWRGGVRRLFQKLPWEARIAARRVIPHNLIDSASQAALNYVTYEKVRQNLFARPQEYLDYLRTGNRS